MPFQVSPGVNVSEIDLTTVVPAVSSTEGAISGVFRWGPVEQRVLVDSEANLAARFGKPTNFNAETFFTAANFLSYGNKLYVARVADTTVSNATEFVTDGSMVTNSSVSTVTSAAKTFTADQVGKYVVVTYVSGSTTLTENRRIASVNAAANSSTVDITFDEPVGASGTYSSVDVSLLEKNVLSAVANTNTVSDMMVFVIKNEADFTQKTEAGDFEDTDVVFVAKYPGDLGNSLRVAVCDSATAYSQSISTASQANTGTAGALVDYSANVVSSGVVFTSNTTVDFSTATITYTPTEGGVGTIAEANTVAQYIRARAASIVGEFVLVGNTSIGQSFVKVTGVSAVDQVSAVDRSFELTFEEAFSPSLPTTTFTLANIVTQWEFANSVDAAPGQSSYVANFGNTAANDELHVVVVDEGGKFSGVPGTILEVFGGLSRATDAKTSDGAGLFYKDVINLNSNYVWAIADRAGAASGTADTVASSTNVTNLGLRFQGGQDGSAEDTISVAEVVGGYDLFASAEDVDVSLILAGKARGGSNGEVVANYIIDNICEVRKDCVAFISPERADVVSNSGSESDDIVTFRNSLRSTSYAVLDSGYKYQYDKYNDVYRWVPLNGDTAGLCVRTDSTRDPWWSPAGFNRGQVKNIVKLAYNPSKAHRDILYKAGVNPVVTFPGQGTILYGDKTLLAKPSAFDRINVRRLFIVLEKAIATAAKFTLFEFNDDFTRSQFRNLVEPFLRDIQGRRGIYDFKVVCDTSNNTGEVIDRNEFVGDIYIKPAKSINFIQLNFVAVRTGVEFSEVVGKF